MTLVNGFETTKYTLFGEDLHPLFGTWTMGRFSVFEEDLILSLFTHFGFDPFLPPSLDPPQHPSACPAPPMEDSSHRVTLLDFLTPPLSPPFSTGSVFGLVSECSPFPFCFLLVQPVCPSGLWIT